MKYLKTFTLLTLVMLFFTCENNESVINNSSSKLEPKGPMFIDLGNTMRTIKVKGSINEQSKSSHSLKATESYNVALYMAEYITTGDNEEIGNTVYFKNLGNKQLAGDFVPGLDLDGTTEISYYVDDNRPTADVDVSASNNAIDSAMATWNGVTCSDLGIYEVPFDGRPTGFISAAYGLGGSFNYVADVVHCGWDVALFEAIFGPDSNVLGVTFTIVFTDENGDLIDLDNNGKYDVAWREIYFNDAYTWNNGITYDIETVSLHEAGHGLSQAHFGTAFRSGNGKLHFSPRAVMNAAYSGVQTSITETDNAGHCSNWSSWPYN